MESFSTPKAPAKLTKKGYRPMPCGRNSNQKMTIKGKVVPRPPRLAKLSVVLRHPERDGE